MGHPKKIIEGGMVGFRAAEIWVFRQKFSFADLRFALLYFCLILSSLRPVYPPYKSGVKKIIKIPEILHHSINLTGFKMLNATKKMR
ncbi:MAG: hypothetical protein DRR00_11950 [Candidatus Parabeggiatoa sp. nov. 3]|nr:MAG: hypothetical protein DRR00_11950 [Gammaproteobacteria bacterium]